MEKIRWENEFSVGIKEIDEQHKELIFLLNSINELVKEKDLDELKKIFHKLIVYSKTHFSNEENLMKKTTYPHYEFHKKEHKKFIDKLEEVEREIELKNIYITLSMLIFLKDWLFNHILQTDKGMTIYLNQIEK